jgi:hypothetical protein
MGGPIKQGIMHGIREPFVKGKIASGIFSKVGRLLGGDKGWWSKIRPTGKFRRTTRFEEPGPAMKGDYTSIQQAVGYPGPKKTAWEIAKSPSLMWKGIKENPYWAGAAGIYGGPAAGALGVGIAKGPVWSGIKQAADLAVPDWLYDQDKHLAEIAARKKEKEEPIVSKYLEGKGKIDKKLTKAQKEKWADVQRGKRLNNLLDIMGYDRSKKTAVADALIDASKIVSERGSLKGDVTRELINPIIQATSKRFDKPEQIREAVGLMMAKGEIEKDLYKWKPGTALKNAQDMADTLGITVDEALRRQSKMATNVGEEIMGWGVTKKSAPTVAEIEQITRNYANANKEEFRQVITAEELKKGGDEDTDSIIVVQKLLTGDPAKDDGFYQVNKDIIKVTNGVPKKHYGG